MAPTRTSPTENTGYTDDTHPYRSLIGGTAYDNNFDRQ